MHLYAAIRPYHSATADFLGDVAMYQIAISMLVVLLTKTGTTEEDGYDKGGLDGSLVVINGNSRATHIHSG